MTTTLTDPSPTSGEGEGGGPLPPTGGGGGDGGGGGSGRRRRRSTMPLVIALSVGVVVAVLVAVLATSKSATEVENQANSILIGKQAPATSGPLGGSGRASLTDFRGKWVLVNFFASWCVPCRQEQADLVKFQNAHAAGDAAVFGVRFDDPDVGPIQDLMNKSGGKWPIVDDPNAKIVYSVTGPPESFLVSPGGIVLVHIVGPITDAKLEELLNRAKLVVTTPAPASPAPTAP